MQPSDEPAEREAERAAADRLRTLKGLVTGIGKRTTKDVFDLGEAFEEAAALLPGRFSAWVLHECRIEPRTVLGYRRVFTVLKSRRGSLEERAIAPSVLVRVAFAPLDVRERALAMIDGGRDLRLADLKALSPRKAPAAAAALVSALSDAARRLSADVQSLAAEVGKERAHLPAAAEKASALLPAVSALLPCTDLAGTLADFANAPDAASAAALTLAVRSFTSTGPEGASLPCDPVSSVVIPARPETMAERNATRFEKSAFGHGLTALELCAGAGGQAYGMARAGFRHVALVENDKNACETLRAAFPSADVVRADLKTVDLDRYAGVDVLAGGPPCVSWSQGGKRQGERDDRDLMLTAVGIAERLRPRAILLENVMGIFERRADRHRLEILGRLGDAGYRCEWREVQAWDFGIAQARRRAILVGFRDPEAMARFAWPAPSPVSEDEVYGVSSALMHHFTADGWEPDEELLRRLDALAPTITGGSPAKEGIDLGRENTRKSWRRIGIDPDGIAKAPPAADHVGPPRLTVDMLATLQGFPMDWPFKGGRSPRFKQIANALPPVVAMHLGCSVAAALTGEPQDHRKETVRLAMSRCLRPVVVAPTLDPTAPSAPRPQRAGPSTDADKRRLDLRKLNGAAGSDGVFDRAPEPATEG